MKPWANQLEVYADLLNLSEDERRRLIAPASRNPDLAETVKRLLRRRLREEGVDPDDLPVFRLPRSLPDGDIGTFHALFGKQRRGCFGIPLRADEGHIGLIGQTGTGKSTLAREQIIIPSMAAGIANWVLDSEDEHKPLLKLFGPDELFVLDAPRTYINPCQAFGDPVQWIGHVGDIFRQTQFCRNGSVNLLMQILTEEYAKRGVFEGSQDYPALPDIYRRVTERRYDRESRIRQYAETLQNRLATLLQQLRPGIMAARSLDFPALTGRSVLFRLHGLNGTTQSFFLTLLLKLFQVHRTGQAFDRPTNIITIEEAHRYIEASGDRYDLGEALITAAPRLFRKKGAVLCYTSQSVDSMPTAVFGNLSTLFVLRMSNTACIRRIAGALSLGLEQQEALPELERRQAVVGMKACPYPFLAEVPESPRRAAPDEDEVEQRIQESLAQMAYVAYEGEDPLLEAVSLSAKTANSPPQLVCGLAPDQYKVMVACCGGAMTPEDICLELKWDRAREGLARKALESAGLVELAGRVSHYKIHQPTAKGLEWAKKNQVPIVPYATKGGAVHAFCLRRFEEAFGRAVPGVRFQRSGLASITGGVQPDSMALINGGTRIAIQVCARNGPGYEACRLLDLCRVEAIDRVISVASSRGCQKSLEKELQKMRERGGEAHGSGGSLHSKLAMVCIGECLSESFDWNKVIEGEV